MIDDDKGHQNEVYQVDRQKVLPFEREQLVDTQTGECPLEPDDDKRQHYGLGDKPQGSGNKPHDMVEAIPTGHLERHPAAEEKEGGDACNDKEVEVLGEIEEAEVDTGILGMVTGRQLALGLQRLSNNVPKNAASVYNT